MSLLSQGAIAQIWLGQRPSTPIVQVLEIKVIQGADARDKARIRVVLSDGVHYEQSMLGTALNELVFNNTIQQYSRLKLVEYLQNEISGRKIIIVLKAEVMDSAPQPGAIGNAREVSKAMASGAAPPPMLHPPPQQQQNQPYYQQQQQQPPLQQQYPPQHQQQYPPQHQQYPPQQQYNPPPVLQPAQLGGGQRHPGVVPHPQQNNPYSNVNQPGSYRPPPQQQQPQYASYQQQPNYGHGQQVQQNYHPISSLNPYQNRWIIKGRVTKKRDVRTWSNSRGDGKLFSVDLLDASGGEIKVTAFNDAVDKFFPLFEVNRVYSVSKGTLKPKNPRFNTLPGEYEITLNSDAEVIALPEDNEIKKFNFELVPLSDLVQLQAGTPDTPTTVDVMGIVTQVSQGTEFTTRAGKESFRRSITLADMSDSTVEVTLWGDDARKWDENVLANNCVLAVRAAQLSDYGGRSLSASWTSDVYKDPEHDMCTRLKQWWTSGGGAQKTATFASLTNRGGAGGAGNAPRRALEEVNPEKLGLTLDESNDAVFSTVVTINYFRSEMDKPPWYLACPSQGCNKKVFGEAGNYTCEKCNKTYQSCELRYILNFKAQDDTGAVWFTAFNDHATTILNNVTASDLNVMIDKGDEDGFEGVFKAAIFKKFMMKVKAKVDMVGEEVRTKCTVLALQPVNFRTESANLCAELAKMITV